MGGPVRGTHLSHQSRVPHTALCWCCFFPAVQWKNLTPLHAAAAKGHVEVVQVLVQAGANLDKADNVRCA